MTHETTPPADSRDESIDSPLKVENPLFFRVTLRGLLDRHFKLLRVAALPISLAVLVIACAGWFSPFSRDSSLLEEWGLIGFSYHALFYLVVFYISLIGIHLISWRKLSIEPLPHVDEILGTAWRKLPTAVSTVLGLIVLFSPLIILILPMLILINLARSFAGSSRSRFNGHGITLVLYGLCLFAIHIFLSNLGPVHILMSEIVPGLEMALIVSGVTLVHHDLRLAAQDLDHGNPAPAPAAA